MRLERGIRKDFEEAAFKKRLEKWMQLSDSGHQSEVNAGRGKSLNEDRFMGGGRTSPSGGQTTLRFQKWAVARFWGADCPAAHSMQHAGGVSADFGAGKGRPQSQRETRPTPGASSTRTARGFPCALGADWAGLPEWGSGDTRS